jgi:phosphonate ABC transporter permease subunit PhnE
MTETTVTSTTSKTGKTKWRAILLAVGFFLLYALAVQLTEVNLEKPLDPNRQEALVRVLRLLADPDFVRIEGGSLSLSETTVLTIDAIIETVLMALMASTIGTLLAVPISFIAARNLMEPVTAPLAAIMAAIIALPIGAFLGQVVTGQLITWAGLAANSVLVGLVSIAVIGLVVWLLLRTGLPALDEMRGNGRFLVYGRLLLAGLLLLTGLGIAANLGTSLGDWMMDALGPFDFWGNFIIVLSDVLRLGLPAFMGTLGGLIAMSYGARLGQEGVLRLTNMPAKVVTAVLSAGGMFTFVYGIGAMLNWLYLFDNPQYWTTYPGLAAAGVGIIAGLLLPPKYPMRIGFVIYSVSRAILNALRSIEPLIMGIVFVVWVGLGPFAGVMALTLHSIAALGKLFSEQVEGIDEGPVEAITATGANRLQTIIYGVVPQIVPPFIAFTLYRWDINVRMSTIIGFVGGGGIGFILSQNIQQLRYRQASVMMIAIAVVVSVLDYVSSRIRARII